VARAGIYPASIATDLSPERLARYFTTEPGDCALRINKSIRDLLVFSEQNLIKDPPFSKLDLISCRNLLIYLDGALQKKLIPLFHYALNPGGYLFLGTSESVSEFGNLFSTVERKQKIYQRKEDFLGDQRPGIDRFLPPMTAVDATLPRTVEKPDYPRKLPLRELTEQALLKEVVQAGALVNAQGDILYLHGRTGLYLEPAPGTRESYNILKMAREGLRRDLTMALHKTVQTRESVRCPGLQVKTNGDFTTVNLIVRPVASASSASSERHLYLVILERAPEPASCDLFSAAGGQDGKTVSEKPADVDGDARIAELKRELQVKEEYLQTTNEELATVNAELQTKVADLSRANNDMNNLLAGTGIATVFVDRRLRILRFNPSATKIINLIQSEIGRPLSHFASNLPGYGNLLEDAEAVLDTLVPKELDLCCSEGQWYTMRIQPYRTQDHVIEGAVLTFTDITTAHRYQEALRVNEERLRIALNAASISVFNQDLNLRYTWMHNPYPGFTVEQIIGKTNADLLTEQEAATLTAIKQQVLENGKGARQNIRTTLAGNTVVYDLTVEPLHDVAGAIIGITCAALDVTGHQSGEERL